MGSDKPFRYTRGKLSVELTLLFITMGWLWRIGKWCFTRIRPVFYHPVATLGIAVSMTAAWLIPGYILLCLLVALGPICGVWSQVSPHTYQRHVVDRARSFLAGFYYRYRPRRRFGACGGLVQQDDPTPTISHVQKRGCLTTVRVKMSHGDWLDFWRQRQEPLAQTFNAKSCSINLYRRENLLPWKHEQVTKYRWIVIEFLNKDPFNSKLGPEYIDYHRVDTLEPVEAVFQNGTPDRHNLAAHRLRVAMTRWGKSVAIRAMIYAQRDNIKEGLVELWGIDGKGGVEQSFMQHCFARVAYGDSSLSPNVYNPAEFDRLLKDAVKVLKRRQRGMRGEVTEHTPTKEEPWLLIVIDEILVLTSRSLNPDLRNSIAASINLIQQQGIACAVSLDASTQFATKEILGNIERGGFTEVELGKVERGAVDMIYGSGWWDRGVKADDIPKDLKGTFYKKTDSTLIPTQKRYPNITIHDVSAKQLGFTVDKSELWPLQLEDAPEESEQLESESAPQPEPEPEPGPEPQPEPEPKPERKRKSTFAGFA